MMTYRIWAARLTDFVYWTGSCMAARVFYGCVGSVMNMVNTIF
jgi:hypothetical protein